MEDPAISLVGVVGCLCPVLEVFPVGKINTVFVTHNWGEKKKGGLTDPTIFIYFILFFIGRGTFNLQ